MGRNYGAKALDLMEVASEDIRRMGQWNNSIVDNSYSSKLPMKAIRSLAGYNSATGMYFNTRTTVKPPMELLRLTPLGFAFDMYNEVLVADTEGIKRTALECLRFFCDMATVLVQDSAAMQVLHPEREDHPIFNALPLFSTDLFKASGSLIASCCLLTDYPSHRLLCTVLSRNNRTIKNK
jgi:Centromere DNA-binding protein complex CBF3 subunit, domain 2